MKLLSIDTSTDYLSIAVTNGDKLIARFHKHIGKSHSDLLVPTIDKLLKDARLRLKNIDGFCISIGPGSFTGLRIGVSAIKGMAYSLKKPVAAVPTLDVIAYNANSFRGLICPVLDARKNKVYACLYKSNGKNVKRISKYLLLPAADLHKLIENVRDDIFFLGDGVREIFLGGARPSLKKIVADWHPRAEIIARLGLRFFKKKRFVKPEDLEPLYLYSKECDITGR